MEEPKEMEQSMLYLEYIAHCFDLPVDVFVYRLHRYAIPNDDLVSWLKSMSDNEIDELLLRPNTEERSKALVLAHIFHMNVRRQGELLPAARSWGQHKNLTTWGQILTALENPAVLDEFTKAIEQAYQELTVKT